MSLELEEVTGPVIGAAIEVHRDLGPGFVESVYEEALVVELGFRGIAFMRQVPISVTYRGQLVGQHRLDLVVADCVVVELKAVSEIVDVHFSVVRSYLRATGYWQGLILNFSKPTLEIRRVSPIKKT